MDKNKDNPKGMVYIVGVGPGDYKLITLKAKECIEKGDVIVYDRLISKEVLDFAKEGSEFIDVGKMPDKHDVPQDEINRILYEKASLGKIVVRVKGGDPFVFGRGGEEGEYLYNKNIKFEIVPGITSAISVPAYAGIPVTHRDFCSSFHVITGHENPDKEESFIDYQIIAKLSGTIVFLMGVKNLENIALSLVKHGKSKDTKVAVVESGTTSRQRTVCGTLENIYELTKKENLKSPAVTVIGEVVSLRDTLEWFPNKPLFGKSVVVTRARKQASILSEKIFEFGGQVIEFPVIKILPPDSYENIDKTLSNIGEFAWIVFTSVNGVLFFFERLRKLGIDIRNLHGKKFCAIGEATALEINKLGMIVDYVPDSYTSKDMLEGLKEKVKTGERVILARADIASKELCDGLLEANIDFFDMVIYKTQLDDSPKDEIIKLIEQEKIDYITFTSSSTVTNFFSLVEPKILTQKQNLKIVCIGPVTAKTLEGFGFDNYIMADKYNIDGLVECILKHAKLLNY